MERLKRGFGPGRLKQYFVVRKDGDTMACILAGPFEEESTCQVQLEALKGKYFAVLAIVVGHLVDED